MGALGAERFSVLLGLKAAYSATLLKVNSCRSPSVCQQRGSCQKFHKEGGLSTVAHGFNPTVLAPGVSGITGLLHVEMQGWEAHINCAVQQLMLTVSAAEIAKVCWHSRLLSTSFVILTVVSVGHKIFLLKLFSAPCSLRPGVNCPQSACTQCHAALHVVDCGM